MNRKRAVLLILFALFLPVACGQPEPAATSTPEVVLSPPATVAPKPSQDLFLRPTVVTRIVTGTPPPDQDTQEPWCLGPAAGLDANAPWEAGPDQLTAAELAGYLAQMGVVNLCLPPEVGAPSLGVDWNAAAEPPTAEAGRRIRIEFDGISGLRLIFATYDFVVGSEYLTHATLADYEALRSGGRENALVTNGTPGFLFIDDVYGSVEKAYVYPFANHYIAVSTQLAGEVTLDGLEAMKAAVAHPPYPPERTAELGVLDEMMASLRLREIAPPEKTTRLPVAAGGQNG